jgi:signal peptidase I
MDGGPSDPAAGGGEPHQYRGIDPQVPDEPGQAPSEATALSEPAAPAGAPQPPGKRQMNPVLELLLILAAALGLWYVTNGWIVKPYRIPSSSMEPTLQIGDRVLVSRFTYRLHDPRRGDIIVFHPPGTGDQAIPGAKTEASVYFIKRIIGLPGETIEGRNHRVLICKAPNVACKPLDEPYLHQAAAATDFGPVRIPQGQYFVMGDNRKISDDSRIWGTLPRSYIIGEAFATYWPLDRIGTL